jgi:4-amino-4-deoxy-L-arabinose transferase-like glycosyltransferase
LDTKPRTRDVRIAAIGWLVWLAAAVWLTGPGFVWQVEYFRSPGPRFFRLLIFLLAVAPAGMWVYQRLRRPRLWRWEFSLVAAIPVAAAFLYEPKAAAVTLAVVFATFVLGRRARSVCGIAANGTVEDIAVSTGLGLGALHCALFLMGLAGWYTAPAFLILLAAFLIIGRREWIAFFAAPGRLHRAWGAIGELRGWAGALGIVFGAALTICGVMVMLAPSVAYDVVRAHLPLVHYYAAQHALRTPAYLDYGYFPQAVETLMMLGYMLAGDAAAQMLPPVYFVLALLMAFRIGRICGLSRFTALAGTLFAAAIPLVHWTGSVAKNDLALAFFMLAALHGYLRWRESGNFRCVLAGAFFLAMGAGIKHSVVYAIPPLGLLYLHAAIRQPRPVRAIAKLGAIFVAFGAFWLVRTWVLTGNPVYPFSAQAAVSAAGETHGWWSAMVRYVTLPWEIHFHGRAFFESPLDHPMGIVLVLFTPLWALAGKRVNRTEAICLFFCGLYLAYWAIVQGVPRFAIAPIVILCVLTSARVVHFCRVARPAIQFSILAASGYALVFGLLGAAIVEVNAPQFRYFARRIDKPGYLRQAMLPYRAMEFLRSVAHPGDAVLSVDSCALVYAPDPSTFDCAWPSTGQDSAEAALRRHNYRFLILPTARAGDAPSGWRKVYGDESFQIYARPDALDTLIHDLTPRTRTSDNASPAAPRA